MINPVIKFSHRYRKMPDFERFKKHLVAEIFLVRDKKDLSDYFRMMDTIYLQDGHAKEYPLPDGPLIIILLISFPEVGFERFIWTTIRRWTPQKESYYRGIRGKDVEIEIKEEG